MLGGTVNQWLKELEKKEAESTDKKQWFFDKILVYVNLFIYLFIRVSEWEIKQWFRWG